MATFYDLDRANARLPELRETLEALQLERARLIELRDRAIDARTHVPEGGSSSEQAGTGTESTPTGTSRVADQPDESEMEARRIELRMRGIVDQMQAAVAQIDAWGITLRDIETGLVDFPALVAGRQVWLCWRLGEDEVGWWHEYRAGVAGRRPLEDLA